MLYWMSFVSIYIVCGFQDLGSGGGRGEASIPNRAKMCLFLLKASGSHRSLQSKEKFERCFNYVQYTIRFISFFLRSTNIEFEAVIWQLSTELLV